MRNFKSASNQLNEAQTEPKRSDLMTLICLAGILAGFLLGACDFPKVEAQTEANSKKENNMEAIQSITTIQSNIPPIDAVTPPQIETATFALG